MLDVIINYANLIAKEKDIHSMIKIIAKFGRDITEADRCSIWLVDENSDELWTIVAQELDEKITIPLDKGVVGHSIKEKEAILVNNAYDSNLFYSQVDKNTGYHTESIISIPVTNSSSKTIAAIQVLNKKGSTKGFSKDDVDHLKIAASYIGDSLETLFLRRELKNANKKLAEQVQNKREELKELNKKLASKLSNEVLKSKIKDKELLAKAKQAQMGEMISVIAHQWKQPLASIYALASTESTHIEDNVYNKASITESIEYIQSRIGFLTNTIDDFRNFFNPDKGQDNFLFSKVVAMAQEILSTQLMTHNITLQSDIEEIEIVSYKNELVHVMLNMINNSKDAIVSSKVDKGVINISTKKENNNLIVEVSDNGGGIDDRLISKLFEPYYSTKENAYGTGLGLYLSKRIIEEKCSGKLDAKNTQNGAIFRIELPLD
jgi:signal transduction histidine kinase